MIALRFIIISLTVLFASPAFSQEQQREFEMKDGDTTYIMKQYFMVFLHSGESREQDSTEVAYIQQAHMNHLDSLAKAGYITMVGPFGDAESPRGIAIYDTETEEMAKTLAEADPAVKAGRLSVSVRPWWCAKGSELK